jgi:hypothetical protein
MAPPPTVSTSSSPVNYFRTELPAAFSGSDTEDFNLWCRRLEVAFYATPQASKAQLATILPAKLSGNAFALWDSLSDEVKADYDKVKTTLSSVFVPHQSISKFQTSITARPRFPNEPLQVFAAEITRLCREAFPKYGQQAQDCERFRRFVAGLAPYMQFKIHEQGISSIEDALAYAVNLERAHEASQVPLTPNLPSSSPPISFPTYPSASSSFLPTQSPAPSVHSIVETSLTSLLQRLDSRLGDLQSHLDRQTSAAPNRSPPRSSSHRPRTPSASRDMPQRRSNSPYPRPYDSHSHPSDARSSRLRSHSRDRFDNRARRDQYDSRDRRDRYDSRDRRDRYDSRDRRDRYDSRDRRDRYDSRDRRDRYDSRDRRDRYDSRDPRDHSSRSHSPTRDHTRRRSSSPDSRRVTFQTDASKSSTNQGNSN